MEAASHLLVVVVAAARTQIVQHGENCIHVVWVPAQLTDGHEISMSRTFRVQRVESQHDRIACHSYCQTRLRGAAAQDMPAKRCLQQVLAEPRPVDAPVA